MSDERVEKILNAATFLFFEQGLRSTTMTQIAQRAGVAKPTLYARFSDKEAVFRAAIDRFIDRWRGMMQVHFQADGTVPERISNALVAKYTEVFDILSRTPRVVEFMEDRILHAGDAFVALERDVVAMIVAVSQEAEYDDTQAKARLILACVDGIQRGATSREQIEQQIPFVVGRLLATS